MSTGSQDFDRAAAEHLLDGAAGGPHAVDDPVARLLARAAAPAQESELAGEEAAVAAFRAASAGSAAGAAAPRGAGRRRPPIVRAFTAKIAAAVLVTVVGGGVAVAAGTGALPIGPGDDGPSASRRPSPSSTAATSPRPRPQGTPGRSGGATASGSELAEQCRAYARLHNSDKAKALRSPRFQDLAEAAGSKGKVSRYCWRLLHPPAHGGDQQSPSQPPGQTHQPPATGKPTNPGEPGNGNPGNGHPGNGGDKGPKLDPHPGVGKTPPNLVPDRPTGRPSGSHRPAPRPDGPVSAGDEPSSL